MIEVFVPRVRWFFVPSQRHVVVDDVVVVVVDVVVVVVDVNFPRGSERVADEAVSGHNFAINVQNGFTRMSLKKHQK